MTAPLPPEAPIDNSWRGYIYQGFAWVHEQIDAILVVLAGLGTMSTQDADSVAITGGSATGMTAVSSATVTVTDNLVMSKTAGEGIKVNPASPAFGWHDMIGNINVRNTGPTVPGFNVYRGSVRQHQCNVANTEFFNEFHVPHDYLPGSDLFIHIHWSQIVVDTGGTAGAPGDAKWNFEITYAKGHQQAAFVAPVTCSVVQTASGTQYQHMIAEVQMSAASPSASQIDSDNIEVDGIILVRTYRDGTDPADTLNQQPFVHFIDIHYQSTGITTKNRAPDFYT